MAGTHEGVNATEADWRKLQLSNNPRKGEKKYSGVRVSEQKLSVSLLNRKLR